MLVRQGAALECERIRFQSPAGLGAPWCCGEAISLPLMKGTGQVPEHPGPFPSWLQPEAIGKSASGLENRALQTFFWRGKANRGIKRNNAVKIPVKRNGCPLDSSEVCLSLEIFNQRQFSISINSSPIFINSRFQLPCPVFPVPGARPSFSHSGHHPSEQAEDRRVMERGGHSPPRYITPSVG